jgi:5'-deoxynucleotidase YfbR-like HD superfamily hydrolase
MKTLKLNYKKILEEKSYKKHTEKIPAELKEHVNALEEILRFQLDEYPPGVIIDSTREHTLKCVHLTETIDFELDVEKLTRTLWIHDIPEIIIQDITVIEKNRKPKLSKRLDAEEIEASQELLNKENQDLLESFNKAYEVLKGKRTWNKQEIPLEMLIAKLIDNTEGNMTFHYFVTKWIKSDAYKRELMFPDDSLEYSFDINKTFKESIKGQFNENEQRKLMHFIDIALENIRDFWKKVPENRIPEKVKQNLKN